MSGSVLQNSRRSFLRGAPWARARVGLSLAPASLLLAVLFSWVCAAAANADKPICPPSTIPLSGNADETALRAELGIPAEAEWVAIFTQSSHLDYDWFGTYFSYLRDHVGQALEDAGQYMAAHDDYIYSVATADYLKSFADGYPDIYAGLKGGGSQLAILGGGVVTADNLIPNGEAFIRNYLLSNFYLRRNYPDATFVPTGWLPDNFGHDPQLPVVLKAMGFTSAAISRVPGTAQQCNGDLAQDLINHQNVDFHWQASDGSTVLGHFSQATYGQGDVLANDGSPATIRGLLCGGDAYNCKIPTETVGNLMTVKTPYAMVPIGSDIASPVPELLDKLEAWNDYPDCSKKGAPPTCDNKLGYANTGVWLKNASFKDYLDLVSFYSKDLATLELDATPFWTGWYASRPKVKSLHQQGTRALLGAETFAAISSLQPGIYGTNMLFPTLDNGWWSIAAGTSHGTITGASPDDTTYTDQQPMAEQALGSGRGLRRAVMSMIAQAVLPSPESGERAAVVFNQLGFAPSSGGDPEITCQTPASAVLSRR